MGGIVFTLTSALAFALVSHFPLCQFYVMDKALSSELSSTERGFVYTAELQWLVHLWNHEKMFETGVVRANEFYS